MPACGNRQPSSRHLDGGRAGVLAPSASTRIEPSPVARVAVFALPLRLPVAPHSSREWWCAFPGGLPLRDGSGRAACCASPWRTWHYTESRCVLRHQDPCSRTGTGDGARSMFRQTVERVADVLTVNDPPRFDVVQRSGWRRGRGDHEYLRRPRFRLPAAGSSSSSRRWANPSWARGLAYPQILVHLMPIRARWRLRCCGGVAALPAPGGASGRSRCPGPVGNI